MAANRAEELVGNFDRELYNDDNWFVRPLVIAEQSTGTRRTYIAAGLLAWLAIYLCIGSGAQFVCNVLGFGMPAYKTLTSLDATSKEEDIKWMTYWVVFGFCSVMEFFSEWLANYIPPYFFLKVIFLTWMQMSGPNGGSLILYDNIIRPFFNNQQAIGDAVGSAMASASSAAGSAMASASSAASSAMASASSAAGNAAKRVSSKFK